MHRLDLTMGSVELRGEGTEKSPGQHDAGDVLQSLECTTANHYNILKENHG